MKCDRCQQSHYRELTELRMGEYTRRLCAGCCKVVRRCIDEMTAVVSI